MGKIELIKDEIEFKKEKNKFKQIFKENVSFPKNVFSPNFEQFIAFEFDLYFHEFFFEKMKIFINSIKEKNYTLFITDPSPEKYFYKKYGKYGVGVISTKSTIDDFYNFVSKDFVKYPDSLKKTDSIIETTDSFACYSSTPLWGMWGDRNWETAIIGFSNESIKNIFIKSFEEKYKIFNSLLVHIENLNEVLNFSDKIKDRYLKLLSSYSVNI